MSNFSSAGQIEKAVFLFQLTFYVWAFNIQTPWLLREFQQLGAYSFDLVYSETLWKELP